MGNDGGSIPGRQDLVKEKLKEKKLENLELVKQAQSKFCALTKENLQKPVCGDKLGLLYNKEALIRALIEKRLPKFFSHISSLKDIKELNINLIEEEEDSEMFSKVICPISLEAFSGLNIFYIIWKCGCVLSKKGIDELQMKDKCINCGKEVNMKEDLVSLNYTSQERDLIRSQLLENKKKHKIVSTEKKSSSQSSNMKNKKHQDNGNNDNKLLGKKRIKD
jgi:hypothetical protein